MLFNSFDFAIFFVVVTTAYFLLPHKFRWLLLLLASCFFYMSFIPVYILVLGLTIVVDYFAGMWIEKSGPKTKKICLAISLLSTISILFVFKYFNFFSYNVYYLAQLIGWNYSPELLMLALPIGLSFHTFQGMSYVIEVYRGRQKAERHFGIYALYVMFYPQLVAGPIERPYNMLHQFYEEHKFEYERVKEGLTRMLWGLVKKMVIADRLAITVNAVYNNPTEYTGVPLILATVFFAFQIYCDFSGYSDIAVGAARIMGIKLMENFNRPYFSKSIPEFWRRWHISLSTWFRDYLYIPLGGNRVSMGMWGLNIAVVFLICGLWHGANWTFVVWGGIFGAYMVGYKVFGGVGKSLANAIGLAKTTWLYDLVKIGLTFALACFAWIFFRANSLSDALYIAGHLFSGLSLERAHLGGIGEIGILISFVSIAGLWLVEFARENERFTSLLPKQSRALNWALYALAILGLLVFGVFEEVRFIYFQF